MTVGFNPERRRRFSSVKQHMAEKGVTARQVAAHLGMTEWKFWRIEDGRQAAPPGYYEKIAAFIGIDASLITPDDPSESYLASVS